MKSIITLFHAGQWQPAAEVEMLGPEKCRLSYLAEYIFSDNPLPISLTLPVGFDASDFASDDELTSPRLRPPAFIYDLVPQGQGRQFLLQHLQLADADSLVMPLVMTGAFNPIGCLRLTSAVAFYEKQIEQNPDPRVSAGFSLDDMVQHSDDFLRHIALHGMLAAGTTGVQGVAPKFLLTQDVDERWYADLALDDSQAHQHWLMKLPRGSSEADRTVLRNEAAYLRLAQACGLRVAQEPKLVKEKMLFVRRFDRIKDTQGVHRLHQESLASLAGLQGFGLPASQNQLLDALRCYASDPLTETVEFLKRDVLNLAMRNTDNHARNTAVQRRLDGSIALTPLFDFAPMFLDPEIVPRSVHWRDAQQVRLHEWRDIVQSLSLPPAEHEVVVSELRQFGAIVEGLAKLASDCGVEPAVVQACQSTIAEQVQSLQQL